ncbi:hypothetical protein [Pseudomonas sp. 65/3-MNA-CIBAN-0223]|uniref:hypothetical protein n=1 Tax=Pseudomonas sp. 65/3-MNA-CIBAN-0223 TaxID=3140476 RepID=UPI00332AFF3A
MLLKLEALSTGFFGISRISSLSRQSYSSALSSAGNLEFATIMKVMKALGLRLHANAP